VPQRERRRFLAGCRPVELVVAEVLARVGERISHVYFPTTCFVALTTPAAASSGLLVGLTGAEGMVGVSLVLGVDVAPLNAAVQGAGGALRMDREPFCSQLLASPGLLRVLNRYLYVRVGQLAQTAVCNRFHLLEARLARQLLMTQDRANANGFHVTQEVLAAGLGVRRAGVTMAAIALSRRNLIGYSRGDITIRDRDGLEAAACGCYAADTGNYSRSMGEKRPAAV